MSAESPQSTARSGSEVLTDDDLGETRASPRQGLFLAVLAVIFFATSPIFTRWASESLGVFEIASGRLLLAGTIIMVIVRGRRLPLPRRQDWPVFVIIGLVAAIHFGFYIASLNHTTIAHSLAIIYTAPIFVALLSARWLHESIRPRQWGGVLLAVLGVAILAGFELTFGSEMLVGDLMALVSAIAFAIYSIAGRSQRNRFPLLVYAGLIYCMAGIWVLPFAALQFDPAAFTPLAIASLIGLALVPLGLGHTLYNAALRKAPATAVNVVATQEVTAGILLGALLLGEIPSTVDLLGVLVTLAGVILVLV